MSTTKKQNAGRKAARRRNRRRNVPSTQAIYAQILANKAQAPAAKKRRNRKRRGGGAGGTNFTNNNTPKMKMMSNFGSRGIRKVLPEFCEQISQPLSSQAWALFKSYSINPGQSSLFPVGSVECQQWQKYRFRYFKVIYEPIVVQYNTNNDAAGEIIIGFDPDASDQPPSSFSQAINMKPVARGRPCDKIVLDIPPSLLHGMMDAHFVRHGNLPGGSDIKTYDVGLVNISVVGSGTTGTTTLGNIFFCYALDLITQQIALTGAPANNQVSGFSQASTVTALASGNSSTLPLASVLTNGLNVVNAAGQLTPPVGNYLVSGEVVVATTGNSTAYIANIEKNSGGPLPGSVSVQNTFPSGAYPLQTLSIPPVYVSCNGTDTLELVTNVTFSTGAATAGGYLTLLAV